MIRMDDGKMNAFGFDFIKAFNAALDEAEREKACSVLIIGNKKALSAGFDLSVMGKPPSPEVADLFKQGSELMIRLFAFPRPVVMASTGHALALGAIMLLTGDVRIAADLPKAKVGMNEVAIGMAAPVLAIELARHRMPAKFLPRATTMAEIFTVEGAVEAGYFDRAVPADELEAIAMEEAKRLGQLKNPGFTNTKQFERGDIIKKMADTMPQEMIRMSGRTKARL